MSEEKLKESAEQPGSSISAAAGKEPKLTLETLSESSQTPVIDFGKVIESESPKSKRGRPAKDQSLSFPPKPVSEQPKKSAPIVSYWSPEAVDGIVQLAIDQGVPLVSGYEIEVDKAARMEFSANLAAVLNKYFPTGGSYALEMSLVLSAGMLFVPAWKNRKKVQK